MNEIPTAASLLNEYKKSIGVRLISDMSPEQVTVYAIKLTRLHVQEALRCASEDARCDWYDHDEISNEKLYRVEKDTILNSYPLSNIK